MDLFNDKGIEYENNDNRCKNFLFSKYLGESCRFVNKLVKFCKFFNQFIMKFM